jgi:hypothetical protein
MNETCSELIISASKEYIDFMSKNHNGWEKAFFRFHINEGSDHGGCGSFIKGHKVSILGVFDNNLHDTLIDMLLSLWDRLRINDKQFLVCLLVVDSEFSYSILFEYTDKSKWYITKIDSDGIPKDFDVNAALIEQIPKRKKWLGIW